MGFDMAHQPDKTSYAFEKGNKNDELSNRSSGALCLINVVAASSIAATAAPNNKIETGVGKDATVGQALYHLVLYAPSHTASVNHRFPWKEFS
jgi:hypothetical protein